MSPMHNQDLTKKEVAVYQAIASLRARTGRDALTISEVAKLSGVGRSTINQKTRRWQRISEVIKGAPSPHVRHLQVELAEMTAGTRKLTALEERVREAEAAIQFIQERANLIHTKLLDQLQYYFSIAEESPARTRQSAKILQELTSVKEENIRLKSEIMRITTAQGLNAKVMPMVSKKRIALPDQACLANAAEFLEKLEKYMLDEQAGKLVGAVYVLVGLPLSGKSNWIEKHTPKEPRVALYIDGTNLTRELRNFLTIQIRKYTRADVHCVRIGTSRATCQSRGDRALNGVSQIQFQKRLEQAHYELEEVAVTEPFDSIILA